MAKKTQLIVGIVVIVVSLIAAIYSLQSSVTPYITVTNLVNGGDETMGRAYHVNGTVVDGSIDWDRDNMLLTFKVTDEQEMMDIEYPRSAPNNFEAGRMVVVSGIYSEDKVFEADEILVKCPSKYAPDESYDINEE
ncbi:MAG: cytochrome c maturation protein CcmE [Halobacteriota archaeon]|nr:cytochrome c maturation protein CcmE [Halobacteriota archaeon]